MPITAKTKECPSTWRFLSLAIVCLPDPLSSHRQSLTNHCLVLGAAPSPGCNHLPALKHCLCATLSFPKEDDTSIRTSLDEQLTTLLCRASDTLTHVCAFSPVPLSVVSSFQQHFTKSRKNYPFILTASTKMISDSPMSRMLVYCSHLLNF